MALNWAFPRRNKDDVPLSPESQPSGMANQGNDPLTADILSGASGATAESASAGIVAQRKKRRDAGQPRGSRGKELSPEQEAIFAAFAELYRPEVWEGVMCGPADTMLAISGRKIWNLSDKERKTISITGAMTAKCFAVENPKWLALILLSINLAQIYGGRIALHLAEKDAERKTSEKAAKDAAGT